MQIALLSNTNTATLQKQISKFSECHTPDGYGVWLQELLQPDSALYVQSSDIFLILDGEDLFRSRGMDLDGICEDIDGYFRYFNQILQMHPDKSFFISNLDIPEFYPRSLKEFPRGEKIERYWIGKLELLLEENKNCYLFDLKGTAQKDGQNAFYSNLMWYSGGIRYSPAGEKAIAAAVERIMRAKYGVQYKCAVLDMDNTLWGGVVGEEGPTGIDLADAGKGARYKDFQRVLKAMKEYGVVFAVCSKNNQEDAMEVFAKNGHMVLGEEDFVNMKINWNPKPQNIEAIAKELNIGLDSFVFIDDNPVERSAVADALPMVQTPEFPKSSVDLAAYAKNVYESFFLKLSTTAEDAAKTKMYRADKDRQQMEATSLNHGDFLKSLQTKMLLSLDDRENLERISQLTRKTNQFNLLTRRYQNEDILRFMESDSHMVFSGSVSDKFGDLGITLVMILDCINAEEAFVDTFLMSCRIMGRKLEYDFMHYLTQYLYAAGFRRLYAAYEKSQKNMPVENFYDNAGFTLVSVDDDTGRKEYVLELVDAQEPCEIVSDIVMQ